MIRLLALTVPVALLAACASDPAPVPPPPPPPAPVVTAPSPAPATIPPDAAVAVEIGLRDAQQRLAGKGYAVGPIDGIAGPRTTNALRQFQRDTGLPTSGRLDAATMEALAK